MKTGELNANRRSGVFIGSASTRPASTVAVFAGFCNMFICYTLILIRWPNVIQYTVNKVSFQQTERRHGYMYSSLVLCNYANEQFE